MGVEGPRGTREDDSYKKVQYIMHTGEEEGRHGRDGREGWRGGGGNSRVCRGTDKPIKACDGNHMLMAAIETLISHHKHIKGEISPCKTHEKLTALLASQSILSPGLWKGKRAH